MELATVAKVGLAGAKCKADMLLAECGPANLSFSWAWCFSKNLLIPPAACLAKSTEGQAMLLELGGQVVKDGGADVEDFIDKAKSAASSLFSSLPAGVIPFAECIGSKVGLGTLVGLTANAATGAGMDPLIAALKPHVIGCGAGAIAGQLGGSPLELAIKMALQQLQKSQPGYIDPKLQAQVDLLFSSGKADVFFATVKKFNTQDLALFDLSTATKEVQEQRANVNTGLVLAAVVGGFLLLR